MISGLRSIFVYKKGNTYIINNNEYNHRFISSTTILKHENVLKHSNVTKLFHSEQVFAFEKVWCNAICILMPNYAPYFAVNWLDEILDV